MFTISEIRARLANYEADELTVDASRQAAVAMLLRERRDRLEMLFIERAQRDDDPWSGQMALPGGMVEVGDTGPRAAAERETEEEVGLRIGPPHYLGPLGELQGRHAGRPIPIVISCFVYHAMESFAAVPNEEVRDALWVPIDVLLDRARAVDVRHPTVPDRPFRGIRVSKADHQIVWGLTYRFLHRFFNVLQIPFPV